MTDEQNQPQDGAEGAPQPIQPPQGVDVLGQPARDQAPPPDPERVQMRLGGLHHITAICANLERTVSFYRDLLGMTLLKQTTNEDDPGSRHFYFGDNDASPGSLITFMEYPHMEEGQVGVGIVHHFALRTGSLEELNAWHAHLTAHGVQSTEPINRTYYSSIYFRDPDGHIVEIATDGPGLVID